MSVFATAAIKVTSLLGITTKGQATKANSLPVVLASDQTLTIEVGAKSALVFSTQKNTLESADAQPLPATAQEARTSITIQNVHASGNLFISDDDEVTVATGYRLIPGESITLEAGAGTIIYGISSAAGNAMDVRIIERV